MRASPYAGIAVAVASVSTAAIFITWSESPPVTIALWRLALATAVLAPFAAWRRGAAFRGVTRRDAGLMALVGAILATHFALWITSLKVQGVTVASSVVIALTDYGVSGATLGGDVLAFLGGVMAGLYFLFGRSLRQRVSLVGYAFVVYATATAVLLVYALVLGSSLAPAGDAGRELVLFLALALIPQIGGHTLYNWSLRWVPAPVVSLSLVGEPIGSSLLAWVLLDQVPGLAIGVGAALALGGIYLAAGAEAARASRPDKDTETR